MFQLFKKGWVSIKHCFECRNDPLDKDTETKHDCNLLLYLQIQNNVYLGMGNRRLSGIINIGLFVALTFHTSLSNVMVHCIRLSMVCDFIFT